jgi:site-specific recombinase XerD
MEMPLAKLKLSDVSRDDVRRWRDSRLKSVQGSTVNREWNLLTHIFTMARDEWELISTNPMSGVKKPKENPPRDRLVSLEEIERLGIVSGFDGGVMTSGLVTV